jgi:hypothetical protein
MPSFEETLEAIRHNAQITTEFLQENEAPLDYGVASLKWLEEYFEQRRLELTEEEKTNCVNTVGSFLGECLCRAYEGEWVETEGRLGVKVRGGVTAFPFSKMRKFFDEGLFDSFVTLFRATPAIVERSQQQKEDSDQSEPDE